MRPSTGDPRLNGFPSLGVLMHTLPKDAWVLEALAVQLREARLLSL